jgi:hypothetical protein
MNLQGCSPRLCRLRADGLTPVSTYWMYWSHVGDMCLVSLVTCHQQMHGLSALSQWLCWERNWAGSREPLSQVERWSQEYFSWEQCIHPTLLMTHERLLYVDHVRYVWLRAIRGPSVKNVWHVGWVFLYIVYIDSNRCDSQIWVTACLVAVFT